MLLTITLLFVKSFTLHACLISFYYENLLLLSNLYLKFCRCLPVPAMSFVWLVQSTVLYTILWSNTWMIPKRFRMKSEEWETPRGKTYMKRKRWNSYHHPHPLSGSYPTYGLDQQALLYGSRTWCLFSWPAGEDTRSLLFKLASHTGVP